MNIFLAVLPEGSEVPELEIDAEGIPKSLRLSDRTWVLASKLGTSAEMGEALGLGGPSEDDEKSQHDRTWVVFKVVEDGYFGYAVASLWQKLADWETA